MGDHRCVPSKRTRGPRGQGPKDQCIHGLAKLAEEPPLGGSGNHGNHEENHRIVLPTDARIGLRRKDCPKPCRLCPSPFFSSIWPLWCPILSSTRIKWSNERN